MTPPRPCRHSKPKACDACRYQRHLEANERCRRKRGILPRGARITSLRCDRCRTALKQCRACRLESGRRRQKAARVARAKLRALRPRYCKRCGNDLEPHRRTTCDRCTKRRNADYMVINRAIDPKRHRQYSRNSYVKHRPQRLQEARERYAERKRHVVHVEPPKPVHITPGVLEGFKSCL